VTVVIGSAMDIVTWCKVPRYLHNSLPLGNPLGEPGDRQSQRRSVEHALRLASQFQAPGVEIADIPWTGRPDWPEVYGRVNDENRAELMKMGEENRRKRAENKAKGLGR